MLFFYRTIQYECFLIFAAPILITLVDTYHSNVTLDHAYTERNGNDESDYTYHSNALTKHTKNVTSKVPLASNTTIDAQQPSSNCNVILEYPDNEINAANYTDYSNVLHYDTQPITKILTPQNNYTVRQFDGHKMAIQYPLRKNYFFILQAYRSYCSANLAPCLPTTNFEPEIYKGDSYDDVINTRKNNVLGYTPLLYKNPIMITQGYMQYVWDQTGKRYLDMFGGIVTTSVGHCHPKIVKAAVEQMNKIWHLTNIYLHPKLHEYTQKLTAHFPDDLKVCYFCNSGSEANDLAMKLSRLATGAFDILSLRNAYHGDSPYSVGLCGISSWKHDFPSGFGIHHVINPDPYNGLWGGSNCRDSVIQTDRKCSCGIGQCYACDMYISQLEETLNTSVPKKIAALFIESIQGVGGTVQYPKGYVKKAHKLIKKHGGLLIVDEVQTGFGRTGKFWGFLDHGVTPEIVTVAKGIGNGFPLAAVITTKDIADHLNSANRFNTFGGNPLSCAVGSAVLDVIDEEKYMENCHHVGTYLLHSLAKLRKKYDIVGDVRGKGLMIGIEMVLDKESRKPLSGEKMAAIFEETKNMGLLIGRGGSNLNVFRIKPPMCISRADADFCVEVLDRAISKYAVL